ncbi:MULTISPECIES: ABC transporter ATP-binding protein [unclassified Nocardiopsis]|uniref:ABC transporter ATP-binding protein n=1 Tax=unclassified Nocardiopsis TaxID=2649073 RepID=UPI001F3E171B|nr:MULTISPECIES: ABC transporter ATP-binding protein [unclassified Nocardiopsis]
MKPGIRAETPLGATFPEGARSAPPRPPAIRAEGLVKTYPGVEAVRGLDLLVPPGELFGLLGPNGAGKSTTVAMLCALTRPTSGSLWVAGHDVYTAPAAVRRSIGVVFQESTLDGKLTVEENLRVHAALYGVPRAQVRPRVGAMLDLADLADRRRSLVRTLSGGMRRRLEIARGLLHRPQVLFLDEPTAGLDPHSRVEMWDHVHRMRHECGATVLLTTHHLAEADHCDRLAIVDRGRVVALGSPAELRSRVGDDRVLLVTDDPARAAERLTRTLGLHPTVLDGALVVRAADGARLLPELVTALGGAVSSATLSQPSLDDVFLHYTGRELRTEART